MTQTLIEHSKYIWLCNAIELMNLQKVAWYPFEHESYNHAIDIFVGDSSNGKIYIEKSPGNTITSTVSITKGTVKQITHRNTQGETLSENMGSHDLRIHAFAIMHFKKFSGTIAFHGEGSLITGIEIQS